MKTLKYIIVDGLSPILFGEPIKHSEAAKGLKVTSAGFCSIDYNGDRYTVSVHGESTSLKMTSNPEDAGRIEQMINYY